MSRRRGEFEHRTSIFEGAFRAWSHLGGLEPETLESKPVGDLDPLTNPLTDDSRLAAAMRETKEGKGLKIYPYEPLPRSGLAHPYIQAILSPWLGPEADHDAIQLGLTTLRTWWQHRRKGESGTAVAALGTDKMRGVVEGYTRHFFNLAYCLVVNDKEQPPRSLHNRMKELEKIRSKRNKKRSREDDVSKLAALAYNSGIPFPDADSTLSPLQRLHASQRRQLAESGGVILTSDINSVPLINMKGKCMPGKLDLPAVVDAVNHQATQLAHRGQTMMPNMVTSGGGEEYGDPSMTPVVFVSANGDIQIAMSVDGITCAHCVKIVETVLKGCNGNKSPIDGLLDAAADRALCQVLIKIDQASNAKRIAFEAARNLSMVGYTAKVKEMSIVNAGGDRKATMDLGALSTAFEVVANTDPKDVFIWDIPCSCPDNGILRDDCARHSQMNTRIFEAFETREQQVTDYMAGCGQKYGMPCTCGADCRCKNCEEHCAPKNQQQDLETYALHDPTLDQMHQLPAMEGHDFGSPSSPSPDHNLKPIMPQRNSIASRNPSIVSFGALSRRMSLTSEATFGRAMSGLSALSIDWENMEDFDVNVDHSAHIDNISHGAPNLQEDDIASGCDMMTGGDCNCGPHCLCAGCPVHDTVSSPTQHRPSNGRRRSSLRQNLPGDPDNGTGMQVTFKV